MSDAQALLERIGEFRRRLERMPNLSDPPTGEPAPDAATLPERVREGTRRQLRIEASLRELLGDHSPGRETELPTHLIARAKRLLAEGRTLVGELRAMGEMAQLADPAPGDPLAVSYDETVAMTEAALRLVQVFPDTPSVQLRLCEGLAAIFDAVRDRVRLVRSAVSSRTDEAGRIDALAELLYRLGEGRSVAREHLDGLCEAVLSEEITGPLRFASAGPEETAGYAGGAAYAPPTRFVAAHSLTVARVVARLAGGRAGVEPRVAVRAALVHDAGMLRVPVENLSHPGSLSDAQRRAVEAHVRAGVDMVMDLVPDSGELVEAVAQHHERPDGTGYPGGLKGEQLGELARLLAVADVYAALATPRPYRAALDPRTALTDTLLLAEKGLLDRGAAERLLRLAFYPVGTVVEMADGSVGVVAANPTGPVESANPYARPVVSLLADRDGNPLPVPRFLDLSASGAGSIVRSLPADQRRGLLGKRFPEYI